MRKLKKSKIRCIFSCILAASITAGVMTGTAVSAFAVESEQAVFSTQYDAERDAFSKEFMSTDFFIRLNEAKENSKSASTMERAVAVALSQEGYKNYSTEGIDIEQAKKDIEEDGYWGIKQTSQRLFDFASALAGDDPEKMKEMQKAMEKGFAEATGAWGDELPEICKDTLGAANKLFEDYYASKNEA